MAVALVVHQRKEGVYGIAIVHMPLKTVRVASADLMVYQWSRMRDGMNPMAIFKPSVIVTDFTKSMLPFRPFGVKPNSSSTIPSSPTFRMPNILS